MGCSVVNRPRALVFDLDDTLYLQADFKRSGFRCVARWLQAQHGLSEPRVLAELEAVLRQFGPSFPRMFDEVAQRLSLAPAQVPEMVQVFIDHVPAIHCFPGTWELLTRLRRDYRLGLLTDGRAAVQWKKICALGVEKAFDEILCSDSRGLEKPAAELFQHFEAVFGVSGEALVYIGDNPKKDFIGARRRGWTTVRVLTGEHAALVAAEGYDADVCLPSAASVEAWLQGLPAK